MARRNDIIDLPLFRKAQGYLRDITHNDRFSPEGLAAWDRFYNMCDGLIRRFATTFGVRSNDDLDDCSQEVWSRLVSLLIDFEYDPKRGEFSTWLYRIVRSATVGFLRKRDIEKQKIQSLLITSPESNEQVYGDAPSAQIEARESEFAAKAILATASEHLTKQNYRLMYMRWIEDRPVREVADRMGLTREQVWYHEHRVRKTLRRVLANYDGSDFEEVNEPSLAALLTATN